MSDLQRDAVEGCRNGRRCDRIEVLDQAASRSHGAAPSEQRQGRHRRGRAHEDDARAGRCGGEVGEPQPDPVLQLGAERQPAERHPSLLERCGRERVVRDQRGQLLLRIGHRPRCRALRDLPFAVPRSRERQRAAHERDVARGRPVPRRLGEVLLRVAHSVDSGALTREDDPSAHLRVRDSRTVERLRVRVPRERDRLGTSRVEERDRRAASRQDAGAARAARSS